MAKVNIGPLILKWNYSKYKCSIIFHSKSLFLFLSWLKFSIILSKLSVLDLPPPSFIFTSWQHIFCFYFFFIIEQINSVWGGGQPKWVYSINPSYLCQIKLGRFRIFFWEKTLGGVNVIVKNFGRKPAI